MLLYVSAGSEYFWSVYFIVYWIYLAACLALGAFIPSLFPARWIHHPVLWLFSQGLLAWMVALLVLSLLNITPLCVGQDNGDGNNDLALCMLQSVLVSLVSSPLELALLCLTALPGGLLISRHIRSRAT